jgi:DHA1 family tetracycline resistance protein-like MFS transporter
MLTRAAFAFIFITVLLDMLAFGLSAPVFSGSRRAPGWRRHCWRRVGVRNLRGRLGHDAVPFLAGDRRALGPLRSPAGDPVSNLGLALDYVVMALAPDLAWPFVGRVLSGITSSSFSTAGAYIADVTPPQRRAARFGMLGVAFGVGFIVGPAVGGACRVWSSVVSSRVSASDSRRVW